MTKTVVNKKEADKKTPVASKRVLKLTDHLFTTSCQLNRSSSVPHRRNRKLTVIPKADVSKLAHHLRMCLFTITATANELEDMEDGEVCIDQKGNVVYGISNRVVLKNTAADQDQAVYKILFGLNEPESEEEEEEDEGENEEEEDEGENE
jgi:hypothetical protein